MPGADVYAIQIQKIVPHRGTPSQVVKVRDLQRLPAAQIQTWTRVASAWSSSHRCQVMLLPGDALIKSNIKFQIVIKPE